MVSSPFICIARGAIEGPESVSGLDCGVHIKIIIFDRRRAINKNFVDRVAIVGQKFNGDDGS